MMIMWFKVVIFQLLFFVSSVASAITLNAKKGEHIKIEWRIPPDATNIFIFIGQQTEAKVLSTISSGHVSLNKKLLDASKFEDRLSVSMVDGLLQLKITDVKNSDEGYYTATAQYGLTDVQILGTYNLYVSVSRKSVSSPASSGLSTTDTGVIIGIVLGIVALVVIIVIIRFCYDRSSTDTASTTSSLQAETML